MNSQDHEQDTANDDIPIVRVTDSNVYVSSSKVIAYIVINSHNGEFKRRLVRTKNNGYMMQ